MEVYITHLDKLMRYIRGCNGCCLGETAHAVLEGGGHEREGEGNPRDPRGHSFQD